jgi:Uma2 family endonuclease
MTPIAKPVIELETVPMVRPADEVPGPPQGQWTYADYAALPDDGRRYEIIDGVLYVAPSPRRTHQTAASWFVYHLVTYVRLTGTGEVFVAPFDVELAPNTVVQPDVVVVLREREHIITETHIVGAPDLVIEIASPGSVGYDRRLKQDAYARAGVREYWYADPAAKTIEVLVLTGDHHTSAGVFTGRSRIPSQVLPGLPVRVEQFFA